MRKDRLSKSNYSNLSKSEFKKLLDQHEIGLYFCMSPEETESYLNDNDLDIELFKRAISEKRGLFDTEHMTQNSSKTD